MHSTPEPADLAHAPECRGKVLHTGCSAVGGLPKPAEPAIYATPEGVQGEKFRYPRIHGGPRQAALLVSIHILDLLASEGFPVQPLSLGENITFGGLDIATFRADQKLIAGEAVLRLTKPRGPCSALNQIAPDLRYRIYDSKVRQRDPSSPVWGWSGFYAAVEQSGWIRPGDRIEIVL